MATVALINNMASQGSITASPFTAKLNGMQIATLQSIAVHDKLGADAVKDGIAGVLLNNKPVSFVGAGTVLGQTIMDMGITTATMTGAAHYGLPECPKIEGTEIVSSEVTLQSEYAWQELIAMAEDLAEATFTLMLSEIFGSDISLFAYAALYRDASEGTLKKPEVVVIKNRVIRYAAFHKGTQEIHVNEELVKKATEEKDEEALTLLYAALNEEFGHYIDWLLRNHYTQKGGDAPLDEGALYGYMMAGFDFFEVTEIAFGNATVDGTPYPLQLDLSTMHQQIAKAMKIYEQEINTDEQNEDYEMFGAGLGNPDAGFYGHYGIEKVLKDKDLEGKFEEDELNFTYLGNFLRDYSQLMTATFMGFNKEERAKVTAGLGAERAKEVLGMGRWLNPLKPSRDSLTNIVEIMAAQETLKHTNRATLEFPSASMLSAQGLVDRAAKIGMKVAKLPAELKLFHQNYLALDKEIIGVYRPEEHIDNPIAASVIDTEKEDYLYCPEGTKPSINDTYGTKDYIRHTKSHVPVDKEGNTHINGKEDYKKGLPTTVTFIEQQLDKMYAVALNEDPNKALIYFGNALHAIEDFFAHTNFVELSLMKVRGDWVFPWVDVQAKELTDHNPTATDGYDKRYKVAEEREVYADFKRDQTKGEHDFFERGGFIKNLTDEEFRMIFSKLRKKQKEGKSEGFSYIRTENGVADMFVTYGLPYKDVSYCTLFYELEGIRYKIEGITHRQEVIKGSLFGLAPWNTYRQVKAKVSLVPDSQHTAEIIIRGHGGKARKKTYEHIPIVTGLFRGKDAMYSISDKMLSILELESFSLMGVFSLNDGYSPPKVKGGKYMISVADYCIMSILTDLAEKQDSEEDRISTHTGKKVSAYLNNYKKFIEFRAVLFSIMDAATGLPKYAMKVLTQAMTTMATNVVKGTIRAMVISNMSAFKNGQGVSKTLGTDPTHTQIAKDSGTHPFHGLAAELAKIAVQDIGKHVHDLIFDGQGTIEDVKKKAVEYISHPRHVDWMDYTVYKWLSEEQGKKMDTITGLTHWMASSWDMDEDNRETIDRVTHDAIGEKKEVNQYQRYQQDAKGYQRQLEKSGKVKEGDHEHGANHEVVEQMEKDTKANESFYDSLGKKMDKQEAVFIEDMDFSTAWIENFLTKMESKLEIDQEEIDKIMKLYEASKGIKAFQDDLDRKKKDIQKETGETYKNFMKAMENYAEMINKKVFE